MKKFLYKYFIEHNDIEDFYNGKITLPINAKILSVQIVKDSLCVYALVDPTETETCIIEFLISATGNSFGDQEITELNENCLFMGTFVDSGALVWHVWMKK